MANYNAIGRVSEALVDVLQTRMTEREGVISLDRSEIALTSPDAVGSDADTRLTLYLYEVEESEHQQTRRITSNNVRKDPPLSLKLHYLLTAFPSNTGSDNTTDSSDQHAVLGLAMQVLNDNGQLEGPDIGPSFSEDASVTVSMDSDSNNKVSRVWDTFRDVPLYPSVTYEVSPVLIESLAEEEIQRVTERETSFDQKPRPRQIDDE